MDTKEKLTALRSRMKEAGVTALYVGTTDPHQTESVAAHWKSVQWLTGFTGSMGYAVVTADDAEFWTDGRYKTQAQREIARQLDFRCRYSRLGCLAHEETPGKRYDRARRRSP